MGWLRLLDSIAFEGLIITRCVDHARLTIQ